MVDFISTQVSYYNFLFFCEQLQAVQRRKRQTTANDDEIIRNGFVTVCEARFVPLPGIENQLVLVWACPQGVPSPSLEEQDAICRVLVDNPAVESCQSPSGILFAEPMDLPSTT